MKCYKGKKKYVHKGIEGSDGFSNLPEPVIHHIMSFLSTKEATRVSMLSKIFLSAWRSYPIIDFNQDLFEIGIREFLLSKKPLIVTQNFLQQDFASLIFEDHALAKKGTNTTPTPSFNVLDSMHDTTCSYNFLDYMHYAVQRRESIVDVEKFKLKVYVKDKQPDYRIDMSIGYAIEHNVKELILKIRSLSKYYSLPRTVLNAKSINVLKLEGCMFKFEDLIPCFTSVEDLSVMGCHVSTNFTILSTKIKTLNFGWCEGLEKIEVDALNLQSFSYDAIRPCEINDHLRTYSSDWIRPCEINLLPCKNLKNLTINCENITDDWFGNHVSEFLLLENLKLTGCNSLESISIFNQKLKSLELHGCNELVEVEIETPNLISFVYCGDLETFFPEIILVYSGVVHAKLLLSTESLTTEWFMNLNNFLRCFSHCKSLSLSCLSCWLYTNDKGLIFPKELRDSLLPPPLCDLNHLRVEISTSSSMSLPALLDSLLWLSPNLETMFISFAESSSTLNFHFQYETAEDEEEDPSSHQRPSWQHRLRKVIIDKFEGIDDKESFLNFFLKESIIVETNSRLFKPSM